MSIVYIIFGILMFGILIAIHELGHFSAAKLLGVQVNEFSIGMGPAIISRQKGETLYSWRALPFGGYCAMEGEDEDSDNPRAFTSQRTWKRAVILIAGSFMNFLLGFLIVVAVFSNAEAFRAPILAGFMDGCPYQGENAFQIDDRIVSIDGHRVYQYSDVSEFFSENETGVFDIVVKRGGEKVKLNRIKLVPLEYEGQETKMYGFYFGYEEATFLNKLKYSWGTTMEFGRWVWQGLRMLTSGQVKMNDMSGPVGIVDLMAETGESAASVADGFLDILYLSAFIAVNLAIMNMLPLPALDGGRVFFLIVTGVIEAIIKRKLDRKYEGYIHAAGMLLLLALMAVIMFNDIVKIVTK